MMVRCSICGAPLNGNVCSYCGSRQEENSRTRTNTYARSAYQTDRAQETTRRTESRSRSAAPMDAACKVVASPKSKWITFLLCLTLGWLGVHRMYVGKIGTGLLWAATGGLHKAGIVLDLILILTDHFTDGDGLPLTDRNNL